MEVRSMHACFWPGIDQQRSLNEPTPTAHQVFDEFTVDEDGAPVYAFTQLMLPYMPYFSNCRGFDSFIPVYALLESSECSLPDDHAPDWWRWEHWPICVRRIILLVIGQELGFTLAICWAVWWSFHSLPHCLRYAHPVFPHEDDVVYVGPWDVGKMPIADWCTYSIDCQYEVSRSVMVVRYLFDYHWRGWDAITPYDA